MKKFSELPLSALLKSNLSKHGFTETTAVQAQAIEPALAGSDLVTTAQTGTGKTLAFVLPLIHLLGKLPPQAGIRSVILTPTRELAIQIHEVFAQMAAGTGIRATVVVGGMLIGPIVLLVVTPALQMLFLGKDETPPPEEPAEDREDALDDA